MHAEMSKGSRHIWQPPTSRHHIWRNVLQGAKQAVRDGDDRHYISPEAVRDAAMLQFLANLFMRCRFVTGLACRMNMIDACKTGERRSFKEMSCKMGCTPQQKNAAASTRQ
jgi:hypothetical protein